MSKDNLVGIAEIAVIAGVTKQAVSNWRVRYAHFPPPIQNLQSGPVWEREIAESWVKSYKGEQTHIISFINQKGGVDQTKTVVAVAEILAQEDRKHVLVIDLDPQSDATVALISEEKWEEMDKNGQTIPQLFEDRLYPQNEPKFNIEKAIVRSVSTIKDGISRLDLLPSSIRLIEIQEKIPMMVALDDNFINYPLEILRGAIQPVIDRYDYIIIDCPPNLGTVTKNALRISTGYLIPAVPNIISTRGIYQIVSTVERLSQDIGRPILSLGIIATKVQSNVQHSTFISDFKAGRLGRFREPGSLPQPPLLNSTIPLIVSAACGADVNAEFRTLKEKYGNAYEALYNITQEIRCICEKKTN